MDEPKQSTARASGFVIPLALALLLAGYLWPEHGGGSTYTRLLGERVDGAPRDVRVVAFSIATNLPLFIVAAATLKRVSSSTRTFVYGMAALLGIYEMLQVAAIAVFADGVLASMLMTGAAGLLLLIAALGAMDRERTSQIREFEGGRP